MASKSNLEKLGMAQAAILSAMLGILALALVHLGTVISEAFKATIHNIGKAWIPGAEGIGPYAGKETIALVVWLVSWFFLHRLLRAREWSQGVVLALFLGGIALATTLLWPPVTEWLAHYLVKGP